MQLPKVVPVISGKISKKLKKTLDDKNYPILSDFLEHVQKKGFMI